MQVTLNIDADMAGSVKEVFAELTSADKKTLARAVMEKFIAEPHKAERAAFEATIVSDLIERNAEIYTGYGRKDAIKCTEEQIRSSSEFLERVAKYKSTREILIEEIITATIETYRSEVKRLVQSDPQIAAVKEKAIAQIRDDFPKYVHDAMAVWFVNGMNAMQGGMLAALNQAGSAQQFAKNLAEKLKITDY
jgi:hypothetical protein